MGILHREDLKRFRCWFGAYVRRFDTPDPLIRRGIRYKAAHTGRVCRNILQIGRSLGLEEEDLRLAETIALFHDLGRFKQVFRYRTFDDRLSENHALLSVQELEAAAILSPLAAADRDLILKAIAFHNLPALPPNLEDRQLLFARLIRDADKLDILGLFAAECARAGGPDPLFIASIPNTPGYSPELVQSLLRGELCNYAATKNLNDRKLLYLSWIYDIYFPYTLATIAREGYFRAIMRSLPDTPEIRAVGTHLQKHLQRALAITTPTP
ncbi:HD domain-containing protein [Thermodesulfitimonas sp.]